MLESIAALFYVIGRELFPTFCFCCVFIKYLRIPRIIYFTLMATIACSEWLYLCKSNYDLVYGWQYLSSFCNVLTGLFLFGHEFKKKFFLIVLLSNYGYLTQTFALVCMQQLNILSPHILLGALTINLANLVALPLLFRFLRNYKTTVMDTKEDNILTASIVILVVNLLGTALIYDFRSPRDWQLLWGRSFNILQAFMFIHIILYLLKEKELHNALNAKMVYIERLRSSNKSYFDFIIKTWEETRRLRHDVRHIALLLKEYLSSGQHEKLKTELTNLKEATEPKSSNM